MTSAPGPLAGLTVIEAGALIAGPFCGQQLGDLGADVIKIEAPGQGDPMRSWGRVLPQGQSLWWSVVGRNKRSVTVDLRRAAGQDLFRRLVARADVLVENFRPGTLEGWGLDPAELQAADPALIVARVSGFGQTGPYANRAGYGAIGEAMGGLRYITGDPRTPPSRLGISIGDALAAMHATTGILAALHHRDRTGAGQQIDAAIYEGVLALMESVVGEYDAAGHIRERTGAILPGIAPSNVYPTADGSPLLIAANQDTVFQRLVRTMGRPDLATDPRYVDHAARGRHQAELDEELSAWTRQHDIDTLVGWLAEAGVPATKIYRPPDMLADPHFAARQAIVRVPHPVLGTVAMQNVVPKLSATPGSIRRPAPGLGEHTHEVLSGWLGLDEGAIASLQRDGVV